MLKRGINNTHFQLRVQVVNQGEEPFDKNSIIAFPFLREAPMVVVSTPIPRGDSGDYGPWYNIVCKLLDKDQDSYLPQEVIDEGDHVVVLGSLVPEGELTEPGTVETNE